MSTKKIHDLYNDGKSVQSNLLTPPLVDIGQSTSAILFESHNYIPRVPYILFNQGKRERKAKIKDQKRFNQRKNGVWKWEFGGYLSQGS